jgi:sugar-specific transcriptional regulator TrmB
MDKFNSNMDMNQLKNKSKEYMNQGQQYYDQAKQSLPEGLSPESFMSKFVRPIIEVITKYIMENYLTEENITTVSNLMQSIVEEFFERLDDIADKNPQVATSVSKLKEMVAKAISKEARRTIVTEGKEMAGGKRKRHTKKRRTGKRRY